MRYLLTHETLIEAVNSYALRNPAIIAVAENPTLENFIKNNVKAYTENGVDIYYIVDDYIPNKNEDTLQQMRIFLDAQSGRIDLDIILFRNNKGIYSLIAHFDNSKVINEISLVGPCYVN